MNYVTRLALALVAAAVAAGINFLWIIRDQTYPQYVYLKETLNFNEKFEPEKFAPVGIRGDEATLSKILVPWGQRYLWYERHAPRDYRAGDPLLQRDMEETPSKGDWDVLGPFRLVGVGDQRAGDFNFSDREGELVPVHGNTLTLLDEEDATKEDKYLLYRYLAAMRGEYFFNETTHQRSLMKIIAVEAITEKHNSSTDTRDDASGNGNSKTLFCVSLDGIPNVAPTWLRIGDSVRFIVPPGKHLLSGNTPASENPAGETPATR